MSLAEMSCCEYIGSCIRDQARDLSRRWLERLVALLPVEANAVFTSEELLDHIPHLVEQIGVYVTSPESADIAANTVVTEHARELGQLRHRQHASVHQVLREYDLLAEVLEQFIDECAAGLAVAPPAVECLKASRLSGRAVRVLMQVTVATFIGEYTDTITAQAARLDQFNRAVSHELRNVFGTIQFGAALLSSDGQATTVDHSRVVVTLRRNTDRALQILRTLENLPQSGMLAGDTPTEQIVDLAELVGEVFRQLKDMADARGVTLRAPVDLPRLYVDTGRLELVLVNLVANAIKYSDPRKDERAVDVSVTAHDHSQEIRVADNGIGIPAAALPKVFERFHRAHPELDARLGVNGTGLGLAIVDECVRALGGEIRVESEDGLGTTFILTLPRKLSAGVQTSGRTL